MFLYLAAHHLPLLIAHGRSVIPNPAPASPVGGNSNAVSLVLGYAKWGALIACGIAAAVSGGLMAAGSLSHRPDLAEWGKRALLRSLGGAVVTGLAIPVLNNIFGAVH
jgi:hypothetical protein